jgi:hypothetical protein
LASRPEAVSDHDSHTLLTSILRALNRIDQTLLRSEQVLIAIQKELEQTDTSTTLEMIAKLPNGTIQQGENIMAVINDVQSVPLSLVKNVPDPTAGGKTVPAPVVGPVVWSSSDLTIVTVTPSADTLTAVAKAVGPNGTATVTAVADGLTATLDITVVDSEVASLTIVAGTPTP